MTVIWSMVPQIWSATDITFCHFRLFFCPFTPLTAWKSKFWKTEKLVWRYYHFTQVQHKWQSHDVWLMRCWVQQTELFVILDYFLHFYHFNPNNPKNQNFEKIKKPPGDTITLHMCTINDNPMMYGSWDMGHNGQNFLSFWTVFCPFTPLTAWKIKI